MLRASPSLDAVSLRRRVLSSTSRVADARPGVQSWHRPALASVLAVLLLSASSAGAVPVGSPSPLADFGPDTGVETFSPASHVAVFEFLDLFDDAPDGLSLFGFYYIGAPESGIPIFHFDDGTVSVAVVDFDLGTVTDFGETDDPAPPQVEFFAPQGGPIGFFFVFSEGGQAAGDRRLRSGPSGRLRPG